MPIDPRDVEICVGTGAGLETHGAVAPPIVQTAPFAFSSFRDLVAGLDAEHRTQVYSRGQNPTVEIAERRIAALERGEACKCFASGMAAISAVFSSLLAAGDHVVFANQIYGPTLQLAEHLERFGVTHDVVAGGDAPAVARALRPRTRLLWLESPGTMLFRVLDVAALAEMARGKGILTAMDNSWATPLFQKPLTLGVDLVVHSCSKYLGGHSDVVAGAVVSSAALVEQIFYRAFLLNGGVLGPFDAWLLIRGLQTLPVRMRQHREDALAVARFLAGHPAVARVHHPGLAPSSQAEAGLLQGTSGLFSFELARDGFDDVCRVIDALRVFRIGVSWGGTESLVLSPQREGNAEELERRGIPPGLIRLSIGLEGSGALIRDLEGALAGL